MNPADLYWVEFPLRGGYAQAGRRPVIVVQSAEAMARLPTILLVPLTTQLDALRFPGTALAEATAENGLKRPSVALVFQLTAVDKQFAGQRLGSLSKPAIDAVWLSLDDITPRP